MSGQTDTKLSVHLYLLIFGSTDNLKFCTAAEHAAAARHRHHGGIVAGSVIGALAALAVFAILLAALCMRKQGGRCVTASHVVWGRHS